MVQGTCPNIYYKWRIYNNRWNLSFKMKGENLWMKIICEPQAKLHYLTLRLVLSLNNPQNSEMNFCENMNLTCSQLVDQV
jgi:hypothetical protein